jgi:uncharacterized protein (DUF1330 family)
VADSRISVDVIQHCKQLLEAWSRGADDLVSRLGGQLLARDGELDRAVDHASCQENCRFLLKRSARLFPPQ